MQIRRKVDNNQGAMQLTFRYTSIIPIGKVRQSAYIRRNRESKTKTYLIVYSLMFGSLVRGYSLIGIGAIWLLS